MVLSMTGFGRSETTVSGRKVRVEIRSFNGKNLDVSVKSPFMLGEEEFNLRSMIAERLVRGNIDTVISVDEGQGVSSTHINKRIVEDYLREINALSKDLGISTPQDWWGTMASLGGITGMCLTKTEEEEITAALRPIVAEAIENVTKFRKQEGEAIGRDFEEKIDEIEGLLNNVKLYESARVESIRQHIEDALKSMDGRQYDERRLEQEMIYYIEKLDINEEKQRLWNHLKYFRQTMAQDEVIGKKLGFIAQEIGREINTLGSKSYNSEMQRIVVKMKDALEKIKEQVANVL